MRHPFFIVLLLLAGGDLSAQSTDRDVLLKDVGSIVLPDTPYFVYGSVGWNDQVQVIATALVHDEKCPLAAVVSSRLGKGKLLILGSDRWFKKPLLDNKDIRQLLR